MNCTLLEGGSLWKNLHDTFSAKLILRPPAGIVLRKLLYFTHMNGVDTLLYPSLLIHYSLSIETTRNEQYMSLGLVVTYYHFKLEFYIYG